MASPRRRPDQQAWPTPMRDHSAAISGSPRHHLREPPNRSSTVIWSSLGIRLLVSCSLIVAHHATAGSLRRPPDRTVAGGARPVAGGVISVEQRDEYLPPDLQCPDSGGRDQL